MSDLGINSQLNLPIDPKSKEEEFEAKRKKRLELNRKAAQESRKRKKQRIEELKRNVIILTKENVDLREQNDILKQIISNDNISETSSDLDRLKNENTSLKVALYETIHNIAKSQGINGANITMNNNNQNNQSSPTNNYSNSLSSTSILASSNQSLFGSDSIGLSLLASQLSTGGRNSMGLINPLSSNSLNPNSVLYTRSNNNQNLSISSSSSTSSFGANNQNNPTNDNDQTIFDSNSELKIPINQNNMTKSDKSNIIDTYDQINESHIQEL